MFNVFVNDGSQEIPNDDIFFIVAKEGIFLKKKLGVMESIAPVKNISTLDGIESMAKMHINKIPAPMIAKTIEFFRKVNDDLNGSEAIVLDFYNIETGKHKIDAPFQKVSGASLDYTKPASPKGWNMIGTIHSHNTMSAFHSSIDDADEKSFDGLHITIGNVDEAFISISASIVSNGSRFIVDPDEYIDGVKLVVDIDDEVEKSYGTVYKYDPIQKKMITEPSKYTYKVKMYDKRYDVEVTPAQKRFNKKWMKKITYERPTYGYYYSGYYAQAAKKNGWGAVFDASIWKQAHKKDENKDEKKTLLPSTEVKKEEPKFTGHVEIEKVEDEINPCEECAFRDHKIDWVLEQITEEVDEDERDYWECLHCHIFFNTEAGDEGICPECKSDMYVMEAEKMDIQDDTEVHCKTCGSTTSIDHFKEGECPFCGTLVIPDQNIEYPLGETYEEIEASCGTEDLERIPIPGADSLPLPRKPGFLKGLFKRS